MPEHLLSLGKSLPLVGLTRCLDTTINTRIQCECSILLVIQHTKIHLPLSSASTASRLSIAAAAATPRVVEPHFMLRRVRERLEIIHYNSAHSDHQLRQQQHLSSIRQAIYSFKVDTQGFNSNLGINQITRATDCASSSCSSILCQYFPPFLDFCSLSSQAHCHSYQLIETTACSTSASASPKWLRTIKKHLATCASPTLLHAYHTMNSLNLLSAKVIGTVPRQPIRSRSLSAESRTSDSTSPQPRRSFSQHSIVHNVLTDFRSSVKKEEEEERKVSDLKSTSNEEDAELNEKTPLLAADISLITAGTKDNSRQSHFSIKRIFDAITASIKWILMKIAAPGIYLVSCFYDNDGRFSTTAPSRRSKPRSSKQGVSVSQGASLGSTREHSDSGRRLSEKTGSRGSSRRSSASTIVTTDSDMESKKRYTDASDEQPSRRSIRIKLNNEEAAKRRKSRRQQTASDVAHNLGSTKEEAAAADLKSPTSPASSLRITKYPHAPVPPRPLIPRRQPSYNLPTKTGPSQKTLVLDLDETLIHSLAKGGRMSTGHMVEVKLAAPASYNGMSLGPQHPILYYVHKRPHCDEFLKKVSKWYNLVVFTASVQEYADPVIDWLEQERKYFSARYYRQHCTYRNGAYIKDLSSVEPDLSKVMILDNSPLSYIFHEDNALPIEGWINDPTDNDLLHILPMLEGLQYVTDVRAFLGLRRGEFEVNA